MMMKGGLLPFLAMVLVQLGYAGMNITSKLAMESGMKPLILAVYRQIFGTLAIVPFAYLLEWKSRPKITPTILFQAFLCSITGATGNQVFYYVGLENSSPTVAVALTNMLPAVTFLLAALFRQEAVRIMKPSGQAKVIGTVVCVGGAMLLSFYHGCQIGIGKSKIHWSYIERIRTDDSGRGSNFFLGPFLVMASAVCWAAWFILQARMSVKFAAPYTSTLLMCLMGSIECGVIALVSDHRVAAWSLSSPVRLIAALYAGVVTSALAFFLMSWTIQRKGPLYVSVFSPLMLVLVAILSWALLREKIYVGTLLGSALVVAGLYSVLWGKDKEMKEADEGAEAEMEAVKKGCEKCNQDLECPTPNDEGMEEKATRGGE